MFFHQRFIPGLAIYSYMIGDETTKQCAVVDPSRDVDAYLELADREGLTIRHALETHVHADYISGSRELKARLGDALTVHCSGLGGDEWTPPYADHVVADGDEIVLGRVRLKAVHTPGHTLEHVCWAVYDDDRSREVPWLMLTGDFLFVGDVGRPDLLGAEAQKQLAHQLYGSVFQKLPGLPDVTEIYPGHGAGSLCGKALGSRSASTIGFERQFNGALIEKPEDRWVDDLLAGMPPAPPYFGRMKRVNRQGPPVLGPGLPGQKPIPPKAFREQSDAGAVVLDARPKEAFAAAHVPGAISIPLAANLPTWAGWVLPYDKPLLLVVEEPAEAIEVATHLIRIGLDDLRGFLAGGMSAWETAGLPIARIETLSVHDLKHRLDDGAARPFVLDVRTDAEWEAGHVDGATHIHGGHLSGRLDEVPRDRPVAVICGSGYRGSIASSLLGRAGFGAVANVLGGMTAWKAADLPTVRD